MRKNDCQFFILVRRVATKLNYNTQGTVINHMLKQSKLYSTQIKLNNQQPQISLFLRPLVLTNHSDNSSNLKFKSNQQVKLNLSHQNTALAKSGNQWTLLYRILNRMPINKIKKLKHKIILCIHLQISKLSYLKETKKHHHHYNTKDTGNKLIKHHLFNRVLILWLNLNNSNIWVA